FKCLTNKIHKEISKDKRRYSQESIDDYAASLVVHNSAADIYPNQIDEKQRMAMMAALEILIARQREVLHLLFFDDQTYEEVSKLMNINVQSVYTLAWKAIFNLKKRLIVFLAVTMVLLF